MARDTLSEAKDRGNLATVFFIAGGVLAAGGITIFVLAPQRQVRAEGRFGNGAAALTLKTTW
jgi:hypothetical protein